MNKDRETERKKNLKEEVRKPDSTWNSKTTKDKTHKTLNYTFTHYLNLCLAEEIKTGKSRERKP